MSDNSDLSVDNSDMSICHKRRINEPTIATVQGSNTLKKARFSWQVKGKSGAGETKCDIANKTSEEVQGDCDNGLSKDNTWTTDDADHDIDSVSDCNMEIGEESLDKLIPPNNLQNHSLQADLDHSLNVTEPTIGAINKCTNLIQAEQKPESSDTVSDDNVIDRKIKIVYKDDETSLPQQNQHQQPYRVPLHNPNLGLGIRFNFGSTLLNPCHPGNIASSMWQKQEVGCAIVDNVFNRTLEELGLSPDPQVNLQATTRLSVENRSIEAAINHQGLSHNASQQRTNRNEDRTEVGVASVGIAGEGRGNIDKGGASVREGGAHIVGGASVGEESTHVEIEKANRRARSMVNSHCNGLTRTDSFFRNMLRENYNNTKDRKARRHSSPCGIDGNHESQTVTGGVTQNSRVKQEVNNCGNGSVSEQKAGNSFLMRSLTAKDSEKKPSTENPFTPTKDTLHRKEPFLGQSSNTQHEEYNGSRSNNTDNDKDYNTNNNTDGENAVVSDKSDQMELYESSNSVLDLAVSTAIYSQGLLMKKSQ